MKNSLTYPADHVPNYYLGVQIHSDGTFINQWTGFRAIASHVEVGPSWYDGQPCLALEYPPNTPIFGNARDELLDLADVVTEMKLVKHPYRSGIKAQKGIEF